MGRIKDFLMEAQEMKEEGIDWVRVKQNEIVNVHSGRTALVYNDLFELDELDDDNIEVAITTVDGNIYEFTSKHITYISGVCIRYSKDLYTMRNGENIKKGIKIHSIPIDKIAHISITQLYDNEVE